MFLLRLQLVTLSRPVSGRFTGDIQDVVEGWFLEQMVMYNPYPLKNNQGLDEHSQFGGLQMFGSYTLGSRNQLGEMA